MNCFIIVFIIFTVFAIVHFIKKLQSRDNKQIVQLLNTKINNAAFWILISSILSLLLGFMHSFYFIGKAGGVAPNLIFQGVSYALITPVLGVSLYIVCRILSGILNSINNK